MTVLAAAGSATELALAADSLTYALAYDPPVLEHEDQPKVFALGGRLGVGTFGTEYFLDPVRFDLVNRSEEPTAEPIRDGFDSERTQLRRHERAGLSSVAEFAYLWWSGHYGEREIDDPTSPSSCHLALAQFLTDRVGLELEAAERLKIGLPPAMQSMLMTLGFERDGAPFVGLATINREQERIEAESSELELDDSSGFAVWRHASDAEWAIDPLSSGADPPSSVIAAVSHAIEADRLSAVPAPTGGRIRCVAVTPEGARFVPVPGPDADVPELPPFPTQAPLAPEPAAGGEVAGGGIVPEAGGELCWCGSGRPFASCHGAGSG